MALDVTSPASAAKERDPPVLDLQLPHLRSFSDICYLHWLKLYGRPPTNLRYFLSLTITNEDTQAVIARALANVQKELGPWPGQVFDSKSDEFKALLGTYYLFPPLSSHVFTFHSSLSMVF